MGLLIASRSLPVVATQSKNEWSYEISGNKFQNLLNSLKESVKFTWVGNVSNVKVNDQETVSNDLKSQFDFVPTFCDDELERLFYNGFSSKILWPTFHSIQGVSNWNPKLYHAYKSFNDIICEKICKTVKNGDVVWVHDIYLMLLPRMLRERCRKNIKIVFFVHTPWMNIDIFKTIPVARDLIRGVAGADKIGFHTHSYAMDFIECFKSLLSGSDFKNEVIHGDLECDQVDLASKSEMVNSEAEGEEQNEHGDDENDKSWEDFTYEQDIIRIYTFKTKKKVAPKKIDIRPKYGKEKKGIWYYMNEIFLDTRVVNVFVSPIGINPEIFKKALEKEEVKKRISKLKQSFKDKKIILSVDRTDFIKGSIHGAFSFEKYLYKYGNDAVYLNLMGISRIEEKEYGSVMDSIYNLTSKINGKIGSLVDHNMFISVNTDDFDELVSLYAVADLYICNSIIDGMNLSALEYFACQKEKQGLLLLSKFSGVRTTLPGSVLFNPWNTEETADLINTCLKMDKKELEERYNANKTVFENSSVYKWVDENVECSK